MVAHFITSFSGHSIDTAAENTEEADVDTFASADGDSSFFTVAMRETVVDEREVAQRIGPVL